MFRVGALDGKEEKPKRTNVENPGKSGKSQKNRKGQIGFDKSKSGNPPFETPPGLPALETCLC